MALDRYMQIIPGYSSNRRQDNLGERTRKGVHELVLTDPDPAALDVDGTYVVIGELLYEANPGVTDLTAITGYDAAGLNEAWLLTPEPARLLDPYSIYEEVASGDPFIDVVASVGVVDQAAFDAAYPDNKIVVSVIDATAGDVYVNGALVAGLGNLDGATFNQTLIVGYNLTLGADIQDGDRLEVRINTYEIHNLDKTVDFTIGLAPAGDYEDTRGMLIAGTKIAYRDKSIRLGSSFAGADLEAVDSEEFHVFSRDTKSPAAKYTPAP